MNFYSFAGAIKKVSSNKGNTCGCFWVPRILELPANKDFCLIHDYKASKRKWRKDGLGETKYSVKLIIHSDGRIEGMTNALRNTFFKDISIPDGAYW